MITKKELKKINDYLWEIPKNYRDDMLVPARVYASEKMLDDILKDKSLEQLVNLSCLKGIQKYGLVMPDCHEGYASPIGGVAAIDLNEGIISPGMCGYDINCLTPDTEILIENGIRMKIKDYENHWKTIPIKYIDFKNGEVKEEKTIYFFHRYNDSSIYQIQTLNGEIIKITGEHPIYTPKGMKKASLLQTGEKVLLYPFKGVKYEKPSAEIILNKINFRKHLKELNLKEGLIEKVIKELEEKKLLPLSYNNSKLPLILKIIGFIFGDGYITLSKKHFIVGFCGKKIDLENIKKDIEKIGFKTGRIINRERNHNIKTKYKEYKFKANTSEFRVTSHSFTLFLISLGVSFGIKTEKEFRVPKWIFKCPLWQKRLFLASLFGAELSGPKVFSNGYNFYPLVFNISKEIKLKNNAKDFLKDIKKLLEEFKIESYQMKEVEGYHLKGKRGETIGLRLVIKGKIDNLIRFFEKINYEYNQEKHKEACLALSYLKRKTQILKIRKLAREEIRKIYKKKGDFTKYFPLILNKYKKHKDANISFYYLYHSLLKEKRGNTEVYRGDPQVNFSFITYFDFKKQFTYKKEGLVWDIIKEIKQIPYKGLVYDLTINNKNHNFVANSFVVSNCGMKLMISNLNEEEIRPHLEKLATEIYKEVPSGLGKGRQIKLELSSLDKILEKGAKRLYEQGYLSKEDIENCEAEGCLDWADPKTVSDYAKQRGRDQVGTLGSGNHFLEIQKVKEIYDEETAKAFGLFKDQITIMIHTGSRGLGHQVATDYIKEFLRLMDKYQIKVPDREFACVPFNSKEGQRYFSAMACAANYAWANRGMIAYFVRKAWKKIIGEKEELKILYDVAHNIIKKEKYVIDGKEKELIVHRKGATRSFPKNSKEIPLKYQTVGQPVLIPGSMGTSSYVLKGTEKAEESFYSTCHGAGRTMSRHQAIKTLTKDDILKELRNKGIIVKCTSYKGLLEEAPEAYKNIDEVVEVVHQAGLSLKVAKLQPLAVIKGE